MSPRQTARRLWALGLLFTLCPCSGAKPVACRQGAVQKAAIASWLSKRANATGNQPPVDRSSQARHKTSATAIAVAARGPLPCATHGRQQRRRRLLQSPPPPVPDREQAPGAGDLLSALTTISGGFTTGARAEPSSSASRPSTSGTPPAAASGTPPTAQPQPGGPGPCTDPALLTSTMSTFCKVTSVDALAALQQDAVQACCRLTSATLQRGCWDPCTPPPAVSQEVLGVVKLWRTICLINTAVTCEEGGVAVAQGSGR